LLWQLLALVDTATGLSQSSRAMLAYKVVETSTVTDESLEEIINEWVHKGWAYDGVQFAMREQSKRPAMAFLLFTRQEPDAAEQG
jgi:hypothetical protein